MILQGIQGARLLAQADVGSRQWYNIIIPCTILLVTNVHNVITSRNSLQQEGPQAHRVQAL